tara:strand:- start:800 stop:1417 length:618 start_codon:yes stop_codon:yes gene_type:complete
MNNNLYYKVIRTILSETNKKKSNAIVKKFVGGTNILLLNNLFGEIPNNEFDKLIKSKVLIIAGSKNFQRKVVKNLKFLFEKSPKMFFFFKERISAIREFNRTGTHAYMKYPVYDLNIKQLENKYWSASSFYHEAMHVELKRKGKKWDGAKAEKICNISQKKALIKLGAPKSIIKYIDNIIKNVKDHSDIDGDGDHDYKDYILQDW